MPWQVVAVVLGEMALLGLVLWLVAVRLQQRARWRFELHARLMERASTPAELQQFFESDGGRRLLQMLSLHRSVHRSALLSIHAGIVLSVLGLILLPATVLNLGGPLDPQVRVGAAAVLATGLGLVLAGVVSHRLGQAWGLSATSGSTPRDDTPS